MNNAEDGRLELKLRRIRRGRRRLAVLVVDCPNRKKEVAAEECSWCESGGGFHLDPLVPGRSHVRCWWGIDQPNASAPGAWSAEPGSIGEAMRPPPLPLSTAELVADVIRRFEQTGEDFAPVIDRSGLLVGEVTSSDLVGSTDGLIVEQVMRPLVFSVPSGGSVDTTVALMTSEGVHRVYVVKPEVGVIGVVTSIDLLAWASEPP